MAVLGTTIYLASRHAEDAPIWVRISKVAASALLALGLGPDLAPWFGGKDTIATVFVMAFGIFVLDILTGLLADREAIKTLVIGYFRKRFGVKNESDKD